MKNDSPALLVCQQCLGKLAFRQNELVCEDCSIAYPISKGLVFMGYAKDNKDEISRIILTEKGDQTNLCDVEKHYAFAYPSFKLGLLSIHMLAHDVETVKPVAVDIGSGGSPMSRILAENGFDTYRCELDPNSLFSGLLFKHPNLDVGKHIVCDCSLLPFNDSSVDVVFCKEFVHHIRDYKILFVEINRILKTNGIFLMIEPTRSVIMSLYNAVFKKAEDEKFGHHYQNICKYYYGLNRSGFLPYRYRLFYYGKHNKLKFLNMIERIYHNETCLPDIQSGSFFNSLLKISLQVLIGGGSNIIFSRKMYAVISTIRPEIEIVHPSTLTLERDFLSDKRWSKLASIMSEVEQDLCLS